MSANAQRSYIRTVLSILALASGVACAPATDGVVEPNRKVGTVDVTLGEHTRSLARFELSETHAVEFFQGSDGDVSVIEGYDVDHDVGSRIAASHTHGSNAELYRHLAGDKLDPSVLALLVEADARPRPAKRSTGAPSAIEPTVVGAAPTDRIEKDAQGDWVWFNQQVCIPRTRGASSKPNRDHCDGKCLRDDNQVCNLEWSLQNYETADVAIFSAHPTASAHIIVTGWDCGFLELGLCSTSKFKEISVKARGVAVLRNKSDDGFSTKADGLSFGVHYLFWD